MKDIFKMILCVLMLSYGAVTLSAPLEYEESGEKNYFQFEISKYHTKRQSGQTVNIYVRYAYEKNLPANKYPDYRLMRTTILKYMEPSEKYPADVYWEILATEMGRELMKNFPLEGVSIQMIVLDNPNSDIYEPGDHGPTFTVGKIAPLAH